MTELAAELGLTDGGGHHVAIVGGGGKTTIAFALADQLAGRAVVTTTTKMAADEHRGFPVLISPGDGDLHAATSRHSVVVAWDRLDTHKAVGVDPTRCDRWFDQVDHVLVEADGSRGLPFKAPGVGEPVVPSTSSLLLSVIGAGALGRVIADSCHRPLRVAALAGCRPSQRLTPERAARVLLHERGQRRAVPPRGRLAVVINRVDDTSQGFAEELVQALNEVEPTLDVVTVAAEPGRARR